MAEVSVEVAGRFYPLTCRDGEEAHLRLIAGLVDAKAKDAARAVGGVNETRQMLLAALLLADELNDRRLADAPPPPPLPAAQSGPDLAPILETLAERIETLAERLENKPANA